MYSLRVNCFPLWIIDVPPCKVGFPGSTSGKEPACQRRRHKRWGVWFLGRGDPLEEGMATNHSVLPEESHGQGSLAGYSPCVHVCSVISVVSSSFDPMYCSPPGSSVHGIFQARITGLIAMPSPWDLPDPGIEPECPVSCPLHCRWILYCWATRESELQSIASQRVGHYWSDSMHAPCKVVQYPGSFGFFCSFFKKYLSWNIICRP